MTRPGCLISLLITLAVAPRFGLLVMVADRQLAAPDALACTLWSMVLAVSVGLSEIYVGIVAVSHRHACLAVLWVGIMVVLNLLTVPLVLSGLEGIPVWEILGTRMLRVGWGAGLGLLSTLCLCGCLGADVVRDGRSPFEPHETRLDVIHEKNDYLIDRRPMPAGR
jgi:hypothetical protein